MAPRLPAPGLLLVADRALARERLESLRAARWPGVESCTATPGCAPAPASSGRDAVDDLAFELDARVAELQLELDHHRVVDLEKTVQRRHEDAAVREVDVVLAKEGLPVSPNSMTQATC